MIARDSIAVNSPKIRQACDELSRRLRAGLAARAEEFLAAEPAIGSDTDAALELLYTEFVVREQLGQQPQPNEWLDRFPQWGQELSQLFEVHALVDNEPTLRTGLSGTHGDRAAAPAGTNHSDAEHLQGLVLGGYEILEEIGRGGMGVVYQARQRGLGRIVALKMILPPHGPRERAQFRAEAEATARLSHPNIVPIYEVGEEGDLPYLSMEFIAGQGLDKQLADAIPAPRAAAELLLTLARAVAYAHAQGIIHRDLKPANIVMAGDGTPKITDFGLARQWTPANAPPEPTANSPPSIAIAGTPSYMAPEQCGPGAQVGPAVDVYSLGAILYEVLTGRPPFRGQTALDILDLVRSQEPVPPSSLVPKTPRDLETICLKCLAKQPQQRYDSATALAEDLRRFLAGEPILARPVGRPERSIRWCRRNPAVAALACGIMVALLCGTAASTSLAIWAMSEKNRAAENARQANSSAQQERSARELADFRFAQAEKAVEEYLDGIENHERLKEADFLDLRKRLLSSAVPFYEEFVRQKPGDAALEAKRGLAYVRLGILHKEVGQREQALTDARTAHAIFRKLADRFPAHPRYCQELAGSHNRSGVLLRELGDLRGAVAEYRQALAFQKQLTADFPTVSVYAREQAMSHSNLGNVLREQGQLAEAQEEHRQGLALRKRLADDHANVAIYQDDLAVSHHNLGVVLRRMGDRSGAAAEYAEALTVRKQLATDFPANPRYRSDQATTQVNLGNLLSDLKRYDEAEAEYRQALPLQARLAAEFPTVPEYRHALAATHTILGYGLARFERHEEAESEYRQALPWQQRLTADFPDVPKYRGSLAETHDNMGVTFVALGKSTEAKAAYCDAVQLRTQLVDQFPDVAEYRNELAVSHDHIGRLLWDLNQPKESEVEHRRAIVLWKQLVSELPEEPSYRRSLAKCHYSLGLLLARVGSLLEGESELVRGIDLRRRLVAEFPDDLDLLRWLAIDQKNLAAVLEARKKPAEAMVVHREALKSRIKLLECAPADPKYLNGVATTLAMMASLSRKGRELDEARRLYALAAEYQLKAHHAAPTNSGYADSLREQFHRLSDMALVQKDHAAAAVAADKLAQARPDVAADAELAARIFGRCVTLAEQDAQLPEAQRLALAQSYADQAMEQLREAVRRGYDKIAALKSLTALAPLRDRPDFQQLVQELEAKVRTAEMR